jgi:polyhydroxyalkanoate synthase
MSPARGQAPAAKPKPNGQHPDAPAARNRVTRAGPPATAPAPPASPAGGAGSLAAPFARSLLGQVTGGLRAAAGQAIRPQAWLRGAPTLAHDLLLIGVGRSELAPAKGDKRFTDPAWRENPFFRALMQTYLYLGSRVDPLVDRTGLAGMNAERVRFGLELLREAMAPTNFFLTNPAAVKRGYDTAGISLWKGAVNWAGDLRHNHGMPSMVDLRPFKIGENLAATPGAVIHRTDVFELMQYTPQSKTVYQRPMLIVPPQVNKYYALDLSPGRSMVEYLLGHGIQVFGISWRNPTPAQRDWDFDTYVAATIEAIDVVREVTGAPDVNVMGGCLGGMTVALAQAHLAAAGDTRINSATMTVTLLDTASDGRMFLFATPPALALAKQVSRPRGVIEGWQLSQMFAWLRPNDLVWNYWVNNYLLGQDPPAFDILAWNADATRLSSRFHRQLLDMVAGNELVHPGAMTVLGTPIDLSRIATDTYVAAGRTDHITPWQTCYRTTQLVSGHAEFVLCSSGHIQTVVADPGHPRLGYFVNPQTPPQAEQWLAGAQRLEGSWWEHWVGWLSTRSGERVPAPAALGSAQFPVQEPAPGKYILG